VTLLLVAALLVPATLAVAAVPSDNAFPVQGHSASSCADDFGAPRSGGRVHQGNDCFAPVGTPLVAVESGFIEDVSNADVGLGGISIWIKGNSGTSYYYAHNQRNEITARGTEVSRGQVIAYVGNTGNAAVTPAHVHFEIHPEARGTPAVDPYPYLSQWSAAAGTPALPNPYVAVPSKS